MEIQTIQKNIPMPTRKIQLVADMVRKMKPKEAVQVLEFTNKAAAKPLQKAIKTALANVKEQKQNQELFVFKSLEIGEGTSFKRVKAAGRGFVSPYKRRTSNIRVVLSDELSEKTERNQMKSKAKKDKNVLTEGGNG